jgi:hypothetical protein
MSGKKIKFHILFYAVIAIAVGYALKLLVSEPFLNMTELDVNTYLDNANSLRGNEYRCSGVIDSSLAWSQSAGRLLSVMVGPEETAELVPVIVPAEFNDLNIQKGQTYQFSLEVVEDGILIAQDLRKK